MQELVLLDVAELRSQTVLLSRPPMNSIEAASTLGQRDRGRGWVTRVSQGAQAKLRAQGGVRRGEATGETSAARVSVLSQMGRPFLTSLHLLQGCTGPAGQEASLQCA